MKFNELNLSQFVLQAMENQHFEEMTEIQEKTIPHIMAGKDVIGKSQTGSGKTFAYAIPAIEKVDVNFKAVQILVVCPTRELASQVCDEFRKITSLREGARVLPIFGGSSMDRQMAAIRKGAKIIVGTPGRLMDLITRNVLKLKNLKMIVLDEADEMLDMGFRPDIEKILESTNPYRQTIMFSATMPKPIMDITRQYMRDPEFIEVGNKNETTKLIKQEFVDHDKKDAILKLYEMEHPYLSLVFCNTKRMVDELVSFLSKNHISVVGMHGDMKQSQRKKALQDLKDGKYAVLVATDVAARGLDVKDIDIVFNYDLPHDVEYYVHRIGRTGRAGKVGHAITLINNKSQRAIVMDIASETKANITEIVLPGDENRKVSNNKSSESKEKTGGRYVRHSYDDKRHGKTTRGDSDKKERSFKDKDSRYRSGKKGSKFINEKAEYEHSKSQSKYKSFLDDKLKKSSRTNRSYNDYTAKSDDKFKDKKESRYCGNSTDRKPKNLGSENIESLNAHKVRGRKTFKDTKVKKSRFVNSNRFEKKFKDNENNGRSYNRSDKNKDGKSLKNDEMKYNSKQKSKIFSDKN